MRLSYRPLALWISSAATTASAFSPIHRQPAAFLRRSQQTFRSTSLRMSSSTTNSDDTLRVALCQFYVTHDKDANHKSAADYLDRAAAEGAQLVVFPEIWNSPYATSAFPEYAEILPKVGDTSCEGSPSSALLMERAKKHQMWIVGGSIPEKENGKVYNTCLVYDPTGKVIAKHRKVHLFDIDVPGGITFFESDTLSAGDSLTSFSLPQCDVGLGICYDIRFPLQAMLMCQKNPNCKLLIFPGAFNMTTGPAHWEILQRGRAVDNQCFVVTASQARSEPPEKEGKYPHYTAWGHSTIVSPWGDIVDKAEEKEALVVCDLNLKRVDEVRTSIPITKQKRTDLYKLEDAAK